MPEFFTFSLFISFFIALVCVVITFRPMPISGALPIAFAAFIGLESVILNFLSIFHLVNRAGVLVSHLTLLAGWCLWTTVFQSHFLIRFGKRLANFLKRGVTHPAFIFLSPFLIVLALTFLFNAPNTWDSLVYHMSRVAHWIQHGSVDYYSTSIHRQNEMGPGAEYLILFFQILTNNDILAGFPQFFAFLLLPGPIYYILRIFKIHGNLVPYLILLTVSTPMAVMQATTTQNDLVCSVITIAIIISSVRLYSGSLNRLRFSDYGLIGLSIGVGWLVKPISLVVAAPFLLIGLLIQLPCLQLSRKVLRQIVGGALIMAVTIGITAGPDIIRKITHQVSRGEVYPFFSGWTPERLLNPISTMAQNMPWPDGFTTALRAIGYKGGIFTSNVFNKHHDFVGNPLQMLLMFGFTLITLALLPSALKKTKKRFPLLLLSLGPILAWISFSLIIRNQPWIARLQLPVFLLLPFAMLYISSLIKPDGWSFKWYRGVIMAVTICSLSIGGFAAAYNPSRPLFLSSFWGQKERKITYDWDRHNAFFKVAKKQNCKRIGMLVGGNTGDYPLTWRAMQRGMSTRHVSVDDIDGWPCLIYTEMSEGYELPQAREHHWLQADKHTWYRDLEYEFRQSKQTCLLIDSKSMFKNIKPMHDIAIHTSPESIILRSSGNDPYFLLPEISCGGFHHSVVLKVEMRSPVKTTLQLFYRTNINDQFNEEQSMKKCIKQGDNTVYFQLPIDEIKGLIRIDPGMEQGEYKLYSLEARTIVP